MTRGKISRSCALLSLSRFLFFSLSLACSLSQSPTLSRMQLMLIYAPAHCVTTCNALSYSNRGGVHAPGVLLCAQIKASTSPHTVGEQLRWLEQDLRAANANRANVPWLVVYGHKVLCASYHIATPPVHVLCVLVHPCRDRYMMEVAQCRVNQRGHVQSLLGTEVILLLTLL